MILYHAVTYYHLLKCAVHKLINHKNEDAVVLVPKFVNRKVSGLMAKNPIFSKVVFFTWERCGKTTKDEIFTEIELQLEKALGFKYNSRIDEINVCRAAFYFGSYLANKGISFNWFEEADGRLTEPEPIMQDDERIANIRYQLALETGLYTGNNPCVIKKYVKFSAQKPGFDDPLAVNFDVIKEMKNLSADEQRCLLDFFDVPNDMTFKPNSVLMLTAHFHNIRLLSYEEHAVCYQLTTDYYLNGYNLYFKWHPSDLMPYNSFMDDVTMVSGFFPSELLTLIQKEPFEIIASIMCTGLSNLNSIYKKELLFNQDYLKTFWQNHRYYFCRKLIELFPDYEVHALGLNDIQFKNMLEFGGESLKVDLFFHNEIDDSIFKSTKPRLYLIDNNAIWNQVNIVSLYEECRYEDVFVFLTTQETQELYTLMKCASVLVKEIKIAKAGADFSGSDVGTELVYLFTKSDLLKRRIQEMKYTKLLTQTGIETAVFPDMDKDAQIIALKGMLRITEQQLKRCQEENAILLEAEKK